MPDTAVPVAQALLPLLFQYPPPFFCGPSSVHHRSPSGESCQAPQDGKIWGLRIEGKLI